MRFAGFLVVMFSLVVAADAAEGVILLHGLARTSRSMSRMEEALVQAGFRVENVDYASRTAAVQELSDDAIGRALASERIRGCARIHFVTHSLGGILVRSYLARHEIPTLGRVVMLGPPNQGSEVVDVLADRWIFRAFNGPAGGELGTGASSTPNRLGPATFELGVIAGDRSINWINSLMIPGDDDGKVAVERCKLEGMKAFLVLHVTHPLMMRDRTVIASTVSFLQSGRFGP